MPEPMAGKFVESESLRELTERREAWYAHVSRPIQFPEPALVLDLDSRRESEARMLKHLHQACVLHRENYFATNQIKHLYLVDAFLALTKVENPLALYAVARSMFELSATLHEVQKRLRETSSTLTPKNWRQVGEKFFGLIIRARFATTHPNLLDLLLQQGVPRHRLKPFHITQCVADLTAHPDHHDADSRYQVLCDFVHHNLGSSTTASSGSGISEGAWSSGGGGIVGNGMMTITQYEYPGDGKADQALEDVAPGFLRDALACVQWLNTTPDGPFPPELLEAITASPLGFNMLREPRRPA